MRLNMLLYVLYNCKDEINIKVPLIIPVFLNQKEFENQSPQTRVALSVLRDYTAFGFIAPIENRLPAGQAQCY